VGIISWIIVGLAAGWLAGVITRTNRSLSGNLVLGLIGALIAGWITENRVGGDAGLISSIIVSALVAAALVFIKGVIAGRPS